MLDVLLVFTLMPKLDMSIKVGLVLYLQSTYLTSKLFFIRLFGCVSLLNVSLHNWSLYVLILKSMFYQGYWMFEYVWLHRTFDRWQILLYTLFEGTLVDWRCRLLRYTKPLMYKVRAHHAVFTSESIKCLINTLDSTV